MILVAAFLLLVALGLLAGGLAEGSAALQWGSFAASALAALVLGVGELRRRRTASDGIGEAAGAGPRRAPEPAVAAATPAGPASPSAGDAVPAGRPPVVEPPAADVEPGPEPEDAIDVVPHDGPADDGPAEQPLSPSGAGASGWSANGAPAAGAHTGQPVETAGPRTGGHAAAPVLGPDGEPPVEEVEVTDLLLVLDLTDEVLVVDEHPRYHLAGCPHLVGVETIPMPMDEARGDGFTPCGTCAPDRHLARRERDRRTAS